MYLIDVVNLASIDLNLLVALDHLLAEKNVSRAAEKMGLSQPAMSNALARLRKLLDDPVLVRTKAGMAPTPRAEALAVPVRRALAELEHALAPTPRFDPRIAKLTFTVLATDYAELLLLPRLAARIAREAPNVDLVIRPSGAGTTYPDLEAGRIDLALGRFPDAGPGFYRQKLFDESFVCVVRADHPVVKQRLTEKQFTSLSHILVAPRGTPTGIVDDALKRLGLDRRVAVVTPHFLIAPMVAAETDLVVTLAERVARAYAERLPLRVLRPPIELPGFTIEQLWHERTHADSARRWLRGIVAELAASV